MTKGGGAETEAPAGRTVEARIAAETGLPPARVAATVRLFDAGNTLPFVARYRKEATGGLDEEELRAIEGALARQRALDARRETVRAAIEAQGALDEALRRSLLQAGTRAELEDLYAPYRQRRVTRGAKARARGLAPLADTMLAQPRGGPPPSQAARRYLGPEVPTAEDALAGARDIVAERVAEDAAVRGPLRARALHSARLVAARRRGAEDERGTYELYYDFAQPLARVQPHQVLALDRGEAQGVLRVKTEIPERDWKDAVGARARPDRRSAWFGELVAALEDGAARLLLPAIGRDLRRDATERAAAHAIDVFAANVRALLLQPPLAGMAILGVDPAYRTGCKVAAIDATGRLTAPPRTVFPHPPQGRWEEARAALVDLARQTDARVIALGNGTASRETEALLAEVAAEVEGLRYLVVSEAGASVYSASPEARAELPELDVSERGAVSIARRAQDPLAELVKIDPRALGVGLYQHDLDEKALGAALDGVVESVVSAVGADLNTASPALLARVAGIGPALAQRIVEQRDAQGPFPRRRALLDVRGLGPKAFEQCAGFLRVRGDEPLDASAIHPESYGAARALLRRAGLSPEAEPAAREPALDALLAREGAEALAAALGIGVPTLQDVLEQLVRPGRDPRADLPAPLLREGLMTLADLRVGMRLPGTVRNVVDFGAFVDLGVGQDGLLHRSRIPRGTRLAAGQVLEVEVERLEPERERIGLRLPDG